MAHTVNRSTIQQATTTGVYYPLATGGSQGSVILLVQITAPGTIASTSKVRLWITEAGNRRLWKEVLLAAVTPSASVAGSFSQVYGEGVSLSSLQTLEAEVASTFTVDIITTVYDA